MLKARLAALIKRTQGEAEQSGHAEDASPKTAEEWMSRFLERQRQHESISLELIERLKPDVAAARKQANAESLSSSAQAELGHLLVSIGQVGEAKERYENALALGISEPDFLGFTHVLYSYCLGREIQQEEDSRRREWKLEYIKSNIERSIASGETYEEFESLDRRTWPDPCPSVSRRPSYDELKSSLYLIRIDTTYPDELLRFHVQAAIESFETVVKVSPQNIDALRMLSHLYRLSGKKGKKVGLVQNLIVEAEARERLAQPARAATRKSRVSQGADFESLCVRLLSAMGYRVGHTGRSGDGGIGIRAVDETPVKDGSLIVQCKDWQSPVGEPVLRDLFGLVVSEGATKGVVITTSTLTNAAESFAAGKPLDLIGGMTFRSLEGQYLASPEQR